VITRKPLRSDAKIELRIVRKLSKSAFRAMADILKLFELEDKTLVQSVVISLIEEGVIDSNYASPVECAWLLHAASKNNCIHLIRFLRTHGAFPLVVDDIDRLPSDVAQCPHIGDYLREWEYQVAETWDNGNPQLKLLDKSE
jgi:hypothetical protein